MITYKPKRGSGLTCLDWALISSKLMPESNCRTFLSCSAIPRRISMSSGSMRFGSCRLLILSGLRVIECISKIASRQIAKSRRFLSDRGNLSKCGTTTRARCLNREICHTQTGLRLPDFLGDRVESLNVPKPNRLAIASSPEVSSARRAIMKLAQNPFSRPDFCLNAKHPSPSARPDRYQPNASSDIESIECVSLMNSLYESEFVGGVGRVQPIDSVMLPKERGLV